MQVGLRESHHRARMGKEGYEATAEGQLARNSRHAGAHHQVLVLGGIGQDVALAVQFQLPIRMLK